MECTGKGAASARARTQRAHPPLLEQLAVGPLLQAKPPAEPLEDGLQGNRETERTTREVGGGSWGVNGWGGGGRTKGHVIVAQKHGRTGGRADGGCQLPASSRLAASRQKLLQWEPPACAPTPQQIRRQRLQAGLLADK